MKARSQIISETLYSISEAIAVLREAEQDLRDCDIPTPQLRTAISAATRFASAVQASEEAAKATRLREPKPPIQEDPPCDCATCDGSGKVEFTEKWDAFGNPGGRHYVTMTDECPDCDGTGLTIPAACPHCADPNSGNHPERCTCS